MTDTGWGGEPRRETDRAEARSKAPDCDGIHPRMIIIGVSLIAILALQLGAIVNQSNLSEDHRDEEEFRRRLTCFIVRVMGDTPRPQILTDCGFIDLGVD